MWAGGQPDFLYPATGDASDYMYAHLGVASMGLEIGDDFYQDCDNFESKVYPDNLNTLMYVSKLAKKPNALSKGPDVLELDVTVSDDGQTIVSADASDSTYVNIDGYPSFTTGEQAVTQIKLYLDVLPENYGEGDTMYLLQPTQVTGSDRVSAETEISTAGLSSGRHVLYAVAIDSDGYDGPISSVSFSVETPNLVTASPIEPSTMPTVTAQTTTTTFTTTTTEIETEPPSKEPTGAVVTNGPTNIELSNAPSNKPSIATESTSASPTILQSSQSLSPQQTLALTSTSSPSTASTQKVDPSSGSSAPTTVEMTQAPSITDTTKSESPTLSPVPSVSTLVDAPSGASSADSPINSAARFSILLFVPLAFVLITMFL